MRTALPQLAALAALGPLAGAQSVLFTETGSFIDDLYAEQLANAFDVDADGYDDVILGMPEHALEDGLVEVRSGRTGAVIHSWAGSSGTGVRYGIAVAGIGDINGDGHAETAFTSYHPLVPSTQMMVHVKDGASGSTVEFLTGAFTGRYGVALAGGGDSDGDGRLELIVGEPGYVNGLPSIVGRVHLYEFDGNVASGTWREGFQSEEDFGVAVAWIGDTDGNGEDEFVVGGPKYTVTGAVEAGRVACLNKDLFLLWQRTGTTPGQKFGSTVACAGDVTGDGLPDVAVGSEVVNDTAGFLQTHLGATGATVDVRFGDAAGDRFGRAIAPIGDLNGDGFDDLAVGAPGDGETPGFTLLNRGVIHFVSGSDLSTMSVSLGPASFARYGWSLASVRDVTGDGMRELAASAPFPFTFSSNDPGRFYFLDPVTNDATTAAFGLGTPGTNGVPTFAASAPPRLGTAITFDLSNSSGLPALGAVLAGQQDVVTTLYGGTLYVVPTIIEYFTVQTSGGSLPLVVPQDHTLSGQRWILQGLQVDAGAVGGVSFSRPLETIFGGY